MTKLVKTITDLQGDVIYQAGSIATAAANVEKAKHALDQATMRLAQCGELHSRAVDALISEMNKRKVVDVADAPASGPTPRPPFPVRPRNFVPDESGGRS